MPLPLDAVGTTIEPIRQEIDARWTMAHAASLDDMNPLYFGTDQPGGVVAHPMFHTCLEWPAVLAARALVDPAVLPFDEVVRGVHASQDMVIHRLIQPGDSLVTTAEIVAVEARSPGAYEEIRLTTVDQHELPVATTTMGTLFLGVAVIPQPSASATSPNTASDETVSDGATSNGGENNRGPRLLGQVLSVPANAAHVYTEGSRIYNPIHTDAAVAHLAGLPAPILHGTATLSFAVTQLVDKFAGGNPARVTRIGTRFSGMIPMPSTISLLVHRRVRLPGDAGHRLSFSVTDAHGNPVLSRAFVDLRHDR